VRGVHTSKNMMNARFRLVQPSPAYARISRTFRHQFMSASASSVSVWARRRL